MPKSKKIVAIGGGEIGQAGYSVETLEIDQEIIRLTRKGHPKLLFLPTASGDSVGYFENIHQHFGEELGCRTETLYLIKSCDSLENIRKTILSADIIYVGGGNTLRMMNLWRKKGIDKILLEAYNRGIVMSGVSAGGICWFRYGNSDSRKSKNPKAPLIKVKGLDHFNLLFCPHYDKEAERKEDLKKMMKKTAGAAIAMDNCAALEVINDKYRIISSRATANAYKVYWKRGKFYEEIIEKSPNFRSISKLLKK